MSDDIAPKTDAHLRIVTYLVGFMLLRGTPIGIDLTDPNAFGRVAELVDDLAGAVHFAARNMTPNEWASAGLEMDSNPAGQS